MSDDLSRFNPEPAHERRDRYLFFVGLGLAAFGALAFSWNFWVGAVPFYAGLILAAAGCWRGWQSTGSYGP